MKYVLIVPDGMADDPLPELDGATPLQAAGTPNMDALARKGVVGSVLVTPPDLYPGSDVANMALLGYDPRTYYSGRGPIEAAAMGIPLDTRDAAFRCSLVATDGERLLDYSAGHISTEEARPLVLLAAEKLGTNRLHLFPGVGYRHILVWNDGPVDLQTHAPHENMGRAITEILPAGEGESILRRFIWDSLELLDDHPFNRKRRDAGLPPANMLWPWGQGRAVHLPSFFSLHRVTGAAIAGVDVVRGLGRIVGLEVPVVPGATGYLDTDYGAKARAALDALTRHDFVWVHIEAPDEAGHAGRADQKIEAIEKIDRMVVGPLAEGLAKQDHCRILIVPDHATPVATRKHKAAAVPFLLFDSLKERDNVLPFDERAVPEAAQHEAQGFKLIQRLFEC
ncbi:MAG: cofactor-independent phosphoglycerate mutase [Chthonomonadales bacterium]